MFLSKLKVLSILGARHPARSRRRTTRHARCSDAWIYAAHFAEADQPAQKPADPEPLDGQLLLEERVQKELKLSKKQIGRIQAISQDVDVKNEAKHKEIKELQKQIEDLRKRMGDLAENVNTSNMQIQEDARKRSARPPPISCPTRPSRDCGRFNARSSASITC